jgi:hypothetical protein
MQVLSACLLTLRYGVLEFSDPSFAFLDLCYVSNMATVHFELGWNSTKLFCCRTHSCD